LSKKWFTENKRVSAKLVTDRFHLRYGGCEIIIEAVFRTIDIEWPDLMESTVVEEDA